MFQINMEYIYESVKEETEDESSCKKVRQIRSISFLIIYWFFIISFDNREPFFQTIVEYAQVKEEVEEEKIDICCSILPLSFEQVEEGYSQCKVMLSFR
jgi:hypothetical protein